MRGVLPVVQIMGIAIVSVVVAAFAETKAPVRPTKAKGRVPLVTQSVTFAKHESLGITADAVRARLREANRALQRKDSSTDFACRVKFDLSGTLPDFLDSGGHTFDTIDSAVELNALKTSVPTLVKIVGAIDGFQCGPGSPPYDGCAAPGHIVLREAFAPLTFPHEFGHHKGINGHDSTPGRIMSDTPGPVVRPEDCAALRGQ